VNTNFKKMSKKNLAILTIIIAILVDQLIKIYVKTHFVLGEEFIVFDWFKIHFVENNGMAMGFEFGGKAGKLFLTLFRLLVVPALIFWLIQNIKKKIHNGVIIAISLVFSGAVGNIIDSVFYGVLFGDSSGVIAEFLPKEGGYGKLLQGKVVDMLYFPLWKGYLPEWLPIWGGDYFTFFEPVFNVADVAISTGVGMLLVFNKKAFRENPFKEEAQNSIISDEVTQ